MKIYIENSKGYYAWILTKHQEGLSADKIVEVSANKNVTLDLVIQLTTT